MKTWILKHWDSLQSSFWFVPTLMAVCAAALAIALVAVDRALTFEWLKQQGWAYTGGAEGASLVLSTIAGSMVTITGVVFSMTLVTLSLASTQLGPRLLRNFMRDRANQVVLGTFVATFVYCLLVLRTIRRADEVLFVPHLSVTVAVVLALAGLGVLIFFIHHVSVSIQADEVIARVGRELTSAIDRLFPHSARDESLPPDTGVELPDGFNDDARAVAATTDGYLQRFDADALISVAEARNLVLCVVRRPGQYIVEGQTLVMAWPSDRAGDELDSEVQKAFVLGAQRTEAQDVQFPVQQLVEIAVRALSPGVNDPFTALACLDTLGSALCRLARRAAPPAALVDKQGRLRVIAGSASFATIVDTAFAQLRQHAQSSAMVAVRMLETLAVVATATVDTSSRAALLRAAIEVTADAEASIANAQDRREVALRYQEVRRTLDVA